MPFWIEGWVEITVLDKTERDDESAWQGVINISPLIDVADIVSERLFGLSKQCVAGEKAVNSLAAERGLPDYPSAEVRRNIQEIRNYEESYGRGEFGGYTYATWREIKAVGFESNALQQSDWNLLFDLMRRLEQDYRLSDSKIRIVVWFNW